MENNITNNYCFRFVQPYMELLGQLTLIAWNTPHLLTDEQVAKVRTLCSLTKCEASVWYLLERARKEKEREAEDGIKGMDVLKTLARVREHKVRYRDEQLIAFYDNNLKDHSQVVQHFHSLRFMHRVNDEQEVRAIKILTMAVELVRLFEQDAAFIFYLETGLTANACRILKEHPLHYHWLIESYVELDRLKERQTGRVTELVQALELERAKCRPCPQSWWKGSDEQWQQFVQDCHSRKWLHADESGTPYTPLELDKECCRMDFLRHILELGEEGERVKPLRPGDDRHEDSARIDCKQLARELSQDFRCKISSSQISTARKTMEAKQKMNESKRRLTKSHPQKSLKKGKNKVQKGRSKSKQTT